MSCDCNNVIDCGESYSADSSQTGSSSGTTKHDINHTINITNLPIEFLDKTTRSFEFSNTITPATGGSVGGSFAMLCEGQDGFTSCGSASGGSAASYSATFKDECIREVNTPYYLDRLNNIFVYLNAKQELKINVSSNKAAAFSTRFGIAYFNKICIPNTVTVKGAEKFILVKDGVETILATKEYEFSPFPVADAGGGIWGLFGNVTGYGQETPDTKDVALIVLAPVVGKLAIPRDNDVLYYGFYDYNAIQAGFVESELPKDDGGKDYFYPYWCRQMLPDTLWREVADDRYNSIYFKENITDSTWSETIPEGYSLPFGSFAVDSEEAFIYSCICQFSDRAGGSQAVVNYASFGDLYKAIYTDNNIKAGAYQVLFPVTPL